jgi:hypothetical protein
MRGLRGCDDQDPLPKAGNRRLTVKIASTENGAFQTRFQAIFTQRQDRVALCTASPLTHSEAMTIFRCPYCRAEYEMTTARLSFLQRSYAKCHVCHRTMYSWTSRNVPIFTFVNAFEDKATDIRP